MAEKERPLEIQATPTSDREERMGAAEGRALTANSKPLRGEKMGETGVKAVMLRNREGARVAREVVAGATQVTPMEEGGERPLICLSF